MMKYKTITSTQNPEIKSIAKLSTKKGRQETRQFIAEGVRVIATLVGAEHKPVAVYATLNMLAHAEKVAPKNNITIASEPVIKKISQVKSPSGILAIFKLPEIPKLEDLSAGLVLAQIADPGNMGTLIRTSAALGYRCVVIIEGCDPYSPKVIQASAGTIGQMNVFQPTWDKLLENRKKLCLTALVVKNGQTPAELDLKNTLLVVGSEAHGLPQEWIDACDQKLSLPMPGGTESLNAAVAGSIALYLACQK